MYEENWSFFHEMERCWNAVWTPCFLLKIGMPFRLRSNSKKIRSFQNSGTRSGTPFHGTPFTHALLTMFWQVDIKKLTRLPLKKLLFWLVWNLTFLVIVPHTTWTPGSYLSYVQYPSLNHPVIGAVEHICNFVPKTFSWSSALALGQLKHDKF